MWSHVVCVSAIVLLWTAALYGESDGCWSRTALIGVAGTNGEESEGLTAADFRVTVGGKTASVQSAVPANRPPRVVILVDVSANQDLPSWATTRDVADEFLTGFPQVGDFTLLTFDDKVERVVNETDRASLQGTVGEIFPSGKRESATGLADAFTQASITLGAYRQGDAEFLITTSDQMQKETEHILSQQKAVGVRLFGVSFDQSTLLGPPPFGGVTTVKDYTPIEGIAKATGGAWIRFGTSGKDPTTLAQSAKAAGKSTSALVRDYFVLELRLATPLTKAERMKIELAKSSKRKADDRFIAYPRELFSCQ
jgi:hypothetical protein